MIPPFSILKNLHLKPKYYTIFCIKSQESLAVLSSKMSLLCNNFLCISSKFFRTEKISMLFFNFYFATNSLVSRAIINSSSVGITNTLIFEFGLEISTSSPLQLFAFSSISTPINFSFSQMPFRILI